MDVFEDLEAEQERLEGILGGLNEAQWGAASGAAGWTIADVVLHLAQSEEAAVATVAGGYGRPGLGVAARGSVDDWAAERVRAEREAPPGVIFGRWQRARRDALTALRAADPGRPLEWVAAPVKPATLATTRLAEHWAHGLDITGPFGIGYPDTGRLRHVAWLAHRTLPYAMTRAGQRPAEVWCEVTAPNGESVWQFGSPGAESGICGPAGAFCRVAARRLAPQDSGLTVTGPQGAVALRLLRTYAE